MPHSPLENINPNIEDAATIFDITPGVELEVQSLKDSDGAHRTVKILGEFSLNGNGCLVVDAESTTSFQDGHTIQSTRKRNLRDMGIVPYQLSGASQWSECWVSKVIRSSE